MGIHFIFDEDLERSRRELQEVIEALDEDVKTKKKADTLKTFARAVALALKPKETVIVRREELVKPKIDQRLSLLGKIFSRNLPPIEKKVIPKPKIDIKPEIKVEEKKSEVIQKDLILDKITNKVLAYVKITDKYYIIEPLLDEKDTQVLNKVLKKRPKNMEKGWKLISKYGNKFKVPSDHFTNVKYFVVNFLYGFGRIEPLVYDADVKEIYCDGPNKPVRVKYKDNIIETNVVYLSKEELENFIYELSYNVKQKINKNNPSIKFNYRDLYFETTISFTQDQTTKFLIKK